MPVTQVPLAGGAAGVAYDRTGTGPGLVLVHGTGATRQQWLPLTEVVADRFTVVAPDYSGSGDTTDHGGPLTLADLADEVLAAADHAGLDRFHLVGHSLGAAIATHLAAHHPGRIRSLVLHAGWVRTDSRLRAEFTYWLDLLRTDAEHGTAHFARMLPLMAFGPRYWERTDTAANEELVRTLAATLAPGTARQIEVDLSVDLGPLLDRVAAPTLVLASAHDRIMGADQQQALLAGIPHTRYQEIDAGHGAPGEDPAGFAALIAAFLDERRAAEATEATETAPAPDTADALDLSTVAEPA
ncbi:alpha/beta fold hydrolase [Streptomyces sp. 769]|uniref:alpha/beta fold hydrolase n=1 Tax=Streptomyces sp. 769 TaxID=1262452 RepID=UPI00058216BD|nr:alpha/beta fold hydrolase [Streptomyces sp. 769]AJC60385.1 alpha/beta hydrolase [Streptomyces sp. 769]